MQKPLWHDKSMKTAFDATVQRVEALAAQIRDVRFSNYLRAELAAIARRPARIRKSALDGVLAAAQFEIATQGAQ